MSSRAPGPVATGHRAPRWPPHAVMQAILGSIGGALGVASYLGGTLGAQLGHLARSAFAGGMDLGLTAGTCVAAVGCLIAPGRAAVPGRQLTVSRYPGGRRRAGRRRLSRGGRTAPPSPPKEWWSGRSPRWRRPCCPLGQALVPGPGDHLQAEPRHQDDQHREDAGTHSRPQPPRRFRTALPRAGRPHGQRGEADRRPQPGNLGPAADQQRRGGSRGDQAQPGHVTHGPHARTGARDG